MKLKHCGPCGEFKPANPEWFYRNKAKPDGLSTECKQCCLAAAKSRYELRREVINAARKPYWARRYEMQQDARKAAQPADPIELLTQPELAYLAGLIDGEGSFGVMQVPGPSRYVPVMTISMTSEITLQWISGKTGVSYGSIPRYKPTNLTQYKARLSGQRLVFFCTKALQYFVTKRAQAEQILNFGKTYERQLGGGRGFPERVFLARAEIKHRIHQLNRPHIYGQFKPNELAVGVQTTPILPQS